MAATEAEKAIKQTILARNAALSAKDVAGVMALRIVKAVLLAGGIEVPARGLEVGRIALRKLVNVHQVMPGGQFANLQTNANALRRFA